MAMFLFYVAGLATLAAAVGVVLARSPLRAALLLIVSFVFLSLLYVLLDAGFVAAMQILVYAGAIMVLFVFVVMLLNLQPRVSLRPAYVSVAKTLGSVSAAYLLFVLVRGASGATVSSGGTVDGTVRNLGRLLLSNYLFDFEAISILLLVAVLGAVVLGLRRLT